MSKRLFLLFLFTVTFGLAASPDFLTAADAPLPISPDFHAVETVPLPEVEAKPAPEIVVPEVVSTPTVPQVANYTVTIYSSEMVAHNLSYSDIYKTGKLVYGHNSGNLLGNLSCRYVGEVFTITEGGVARNYVVSDIGLYEKTADGFLNGNKGLMGRIMRSALGHDVALMTCAGTSYGNGDASHRLVVYADAV